MGDSESRPEDRREEEVSPAARAYFGFADSTAIPSPPLQISGVDFVVIAVRWPEEVVGALLPKELAPSPALSGLVYVFGTDRPGIGSPYSCCFAAIEVQGFDSPDGSHAHYIVAGYVSGRAGEMIRRKINANFLPGRSRQFRDGDVVCGIGGPDGRDHMTLALRSTLSVVRDTSGIHNFLGRDPRGRGVHLYSVAFSGDIHYAVPVAVDILEGASDPLAMMKPAELLWGAYCPGLTLTYGAPSLISETADIVREGARTWLLDAFANIGRAAVIARSDGRVVVRNSQAESLYGELTNVVDLATTVAEKTTIRSLINTAMASPRTAFELDPIPVKGPSGDLLLLNVMPVDPAIAGQPAVLLLFSGAAMRPSTSVGRALQLLGLTAAETRIAALVGAGKSPKDAAQELQLTVNTVRSALKLIYDKLGIARQSELAKLVARLEA